MTDARTSLLTPEDLGYIHELAIPPGLRADLVQLHLGQIVFTVKGLQFYGYACRRYGVLFDPHTVGTKRDLLLLNQQIRAIRSQQASAELRSALESKSLPANQREFARALLSGEATALRHASTRRVLFAMAGDNVIGIGAHS